MRPATLKLPPSTVIFPVLLYVSELPGLVPILYVPLVILIRPPDNNAVPNCPTIVADELLSQIPPDEGIVYDAISKTGLLKEFVPIILNVPLVIDKKPWAVADCT